MAWVCLAYPISADENRLFPTDQFNQTDLGETHS